jgi:hypothetical protein
MSEPQRTKILPLQLFERHSKCSRAKWKISSITYMDVNFWEVKFSCGENSHATEVKFSNISQEKLICKINVKPPKCKNLRLSFSFASRNASTVKILLHYRCR